MTRRVCPACQRRWAGWIAPDCDVCRGEGRLELGEAAVKTEGPDVTSRAVELALESAARYALADLTFTYDTAHRALTDAVKALQTARILAGPGPAANYPVIARRPLQAGTAMTLDAPPLLWDAHDRPVAAGIPGFSAAGYISRMARIADPLDLFGPSTSERHQQHSTLEQRATRLAAIASNY